MSYNKSYRNNFISINSNSNSCISIRMLSVHDGRARLLSYSEQILVKLLVKISYNYFTVNFPVSSQSSKIHPDDIPHQLKNFLQYSHQ